MDQSTLTNHEQCPHCSRFDNRGVTVNGVIIRDGKILLIRRGVEPWKGMWALPGGFVEWDETTEDAVRRELKEEIALDVQKVKLIGAFSDPARHPKQVINLSYLIEAYTGEPQHGDDAAEVKWFALDELPETMACDHKSIIEFALSSWSK